MATEPQNQQIMEYANHEAAALCASIAADPKDLAAQGEKLYDLKLAVCAKAAELSDSEAPEELVWNLAQVLPAYDTSGLYQTRASIWGMAAAVLLGWLLGGFLATLLNLFSLGGDILRPASIFLLLWLGEYLGCNPKARRVMLAILGFGALTRLAASMAAGAIRGFGALRLALGGISAGASIFRLVWLWFGAILLFIFFSRKVTGLDLPGFEEKLATQIQQQIALCIFVFKTVAARNAPEPAKEAGPYCPRNACQLAQAAIDLLPSLDKEKAAWLTNILEQTGYKPDASQDKYLIWNPEEHEKLYDTIGMVNKGDRCLILKRPWSSGEKIKRGLTQRVVS